MEAVYIKRLSRLYFLRRLWSLNICKLLLCSFCQTVGCGCLHIWQGETQDLGSFCLPIYPSIHPSIMQYLAKLYNIIFYLIPDRGRLCGGSTPPPVHRCECRCSHHSGTKSGKCSVMCFSTSSCSKFRRKKKANKNSRTEWKTGLSTWRLHISDAEMLVVGIWWSGLTCEVYPVWRHPPLAHSHSHTRRFVSSSYTHIHACGRRSCPLQPPPVLERRNEACCPDLPSLGCQWDTTHM